QAVINVQCQAIIPANAATAAQIAAGGAGTELLQLHALGAHHRIPVEVDGRESGDSFLQQAHRGQSGDVQRVDPAGSTEFGTVDLEAEFLLLRGQRDGLCRHLVHDAEDL